MDLRIEFHTGVADELGFSCRLLRKAYRTGARVVVTAAPATLARLDRELWTFAERDFVPHLRFAAAAGLPATAARTPVWLVDGGWPDPCPPVLVNLGAELPPSTAGLTRVIEIVSTDPDAHRRGRERWRAWKERGFDVQHHPAAEGRDD